MTRSVIVPGVGRTGLRKTGTLIVGVGSQEDQPRTKEAVCQGSEWIEGSKRSENNWLGSCQTHDVGISPQKDCGGAAGEVGKGEGGEEVGSLRFGWVRRTARLPLSASLFSKPGRLPEQRGLSSRRKP
jgi:hypothetical protein